MRFHGFSPQRFPFFYGWVILFAGTLGILASIPGQTFGVSAFTEPLLEALSLNRNQLSLAYLVGTVGSSLVLTFAGRAYDCFGARRVATAACMLMGVTLGILSRVDRLVAGLLSAVPLLSPTSAGFIVLCFCFFLLRFSAQGVLTMVSRNMMMKWFDRHRGLVTGISGFLISPLFSMAPSLLNQLVETQGWRETWWMLGLGMGCGFTLLVLLLFRDNPEDYGLKPDGPLADRALGSQRQRRAVSPDVTLAEARRTLTFWTYAVGISLFGMFMTGLSFHIASIFEAVGFTAKEGFALFIPSAVLALVLRPFVGVAADRYPVQNLFVYMMAALILSGIGLWRLGGSGGKILLIIGNGMAGSVYGTLISVTWPNLYGRRHLGAISGLAMSVTVFTSALGPTLFSLSYSWQGSYKLCGIAIVGLAAIATLISFRLRDPQSWEKEG